MLSEPEIVLLVVFSVLIVTNLTGNALVCLVVFKNKYMRTPMNFLLVNLALADMLVALGIAPQYVFNHAFRHPQGRAGMYVCKFLTGGNLLWVGGTASVVSLVAIAFERYYAIVYPHLERRRMTTTKILIIVLSSWLVAFLINIAPFYVISYNKEQDFCVEDWPYLSHAKFYSSFVLCTNVILPLSIMSFLYAKIILNLWGKGNRVSDPQLSPRIVVMKTRKKLTKMILMVTAIYALCWSPVLIFYNLAYYSPDVQYGSNAYNASVVFVCLNSSINPFVYALQSERFRGSFKKLLFCAGVKRQEVRADKLKGNQGKLAAVRMTRIVIKPVNPEPIDITPIDKEEVPGKTSTE